MNTCVRCGSKECAAGPPAPGLGSTAMHIIECRDRELANLRSLLRSVTGRLENALEHLSDAESSVHVAKAEQGITAVLEILS